MIRAAMMAVFLAACVSIPGRPGIAGLEAVVKPGTLAIFGEIHGTEETPAFVADAAVSLARTSRVHLGLELPSADTPAMQAFLAGDDQALLSHATWTRSYQDGRTSKAMFAMLQTLRAARKSGLPIEIFFFDDFERLGVERRDEAMAENIAHERARAPADIYLIEVGNYHAKSSPGAPWDPDRRWMASYLKGPGVLTFDVSAPVGSAWTCGSAEEKSCGAHKAGTHVKPDGMPAHALILRSLDGYDGVFVLASLTASPPAAR